MIEVKRGELSLTANDVYFLRAIDSAFKPSVGRDAYQAAIKSAEFFEHQNSVLRRELRRSHRALLQASVIAGLMATLAISGWWCAWLSSGSLFGK